MSSFSRANLMLIVAALVGQALYIHNRRRDARRKMARQG
jgi:hypothetical protein